MPRSVPWRLRRERESAEHYTRLREDAEFASKIGPALIEASVELDPNVPSAPGARLIDRSPGSRDAAARLQEMLVEAMEAGDH